MGLNDSYLQVRSTILSKEVLLDVRSAYATMPSEESYRVTVGSIVGSSQRNQASAFVSNMHNSQNFKRSNHNFSTTRPSRPNNLNNNRQGGGSGLNNNRQGANQHMTYTDKELDNILDISHLKIKVGHRNRTEAYISEIGNLILSNGLPLFNDLKKGKSDSSSSSVSGSNINIADFQVDFEKDVDSSDNLVATQNEEVATLEENVFSKDEVVYMKPPEGYFPYDNKVCRLQKSLYGLKQALRQWNAKLTSNLIENGFSQSKSDYSLYTKFDKGVFLALLVYVDDIIITGNSIYEIEKFKVYLMSKFMIKDLVKLKYFLGTEVIDTDKGIFLNQRKYVLDFLSEYGMLACNPVKTPLMSKLIISNESSENDPLL
nr:ribonuclease H-like domain-containing protein [Tanacetum cinerariifolium]